MGGCCSNRRLIVVLREVIGFDIQVLLLFSVKHARLFKAQLAYSNKEIEENGRLEITYIIHKTK